MSLEPEDHGEAIAIFRAEVIGALTKTELSRGDLKAELRRLSQQRLKPPGQDRPRRSRSRRWSAGTTATSAAASRRSSRRRGRIEGERGTCRPR